MKSIKYLLLYGLSLTLFIIQGCTTDKTDSNLKLTPGLIGAYYGNADLTNIKEPEILSSLDNKWDEDTGHGSEWSGKWEGMLAVPTTGGITIHLETNKEAECNIGENKLKIAGDQTKASMQMDVKEEYRYPITVIYLHDRGESGYLNISWSWEGQEKTTIPETAFGFNAEQGKRWNWIPEPDPQTIDYTKFYYPEAEHKIVHYEQSMFGGWPANNGIWSWGDEILVGFTLGHYKENLLHHSIDESKPSRSMLARSLDGGKTWTVEYPDTYPDDDREALPPKEKVDFSNPDLAIRCTREAFFVSYDRGKQWEGPYLFPKFDQEKLTPRTDYITIDENKCLFFLSAEDKSVEAQLQDRAFVASTTNGGQTIEFLSWICPPPDKYRSVMPSSIKLDDGKIITALRRRYDESFWDKIPHLANNWIGLYQSENNGKSWQFLSRAAETDMGKHTGNPPCLIRLKDDRLCVTYGYRAVPYGIRAKLSSDKGKTWSETIHLRDHAREFDVGYTRTIQRTDGKIVTIYYFTTNEKYEQHIAATIWDPDSIIK